MHNCHFVQLEVFVLKNFLFSQQKSRLFFDDHQPCLFLPIKHFRFFISLLFINKNFHWQLLGDFWPKLCLSRWHILYWIAWITPAWPNILDNSKKELQPWCCKGILLTKKGKMERHEINHCLFYQCEMGLRHNMRWLKNSRFHKRKLRFLLSFTIRRSSYKSQASVTAPLGPPSLDLTTEFDLLNGKIISKKFYFKAHN